MRSDCGGGALRVDVSSCDRCRNPPSAVVAGRIRTVVGVRRYSKICSEG